MRSRGRIAPPQGETHRRLDCRKDAHQTLCDPVASRDLACQLVLAFHHPILVDERPPGLLRQSLRVSDHLAARLLHEVAKVAHDVNAEPIQQVGHVVCKPKTAEMAVDDQPVDRGEGALKLILMHQLESARHARLRRGDDHPSWIPIREESIRVGLRP